MTNKTLECKIDLIKDVEHFYIHTDAGHRIPHIRKVMAAAIVICGKLGKGEHIPNALVAIAYHDIFSTPKDRANHHLLAGNWVLDNKDELKQKYGLSYKDLLEISDAIKEHRASYTGEYSGTLSEIVAAADRGVVGDSLTEDYVMRSYLYARTNCGKSVYDAKLHAIRQIQKRFGSKGIYRVPSWYRSMFKEALELREREVDELDEEFFTTARIAEYEKTVNEYLSE